MGEYEEEVDDLLDDSDEDDVNSSAFEDAHADLLALDDMRITTTQDKMKKSVGDDLLDDIFPLSIEMDDDDDESDDEAERRRRRTDAKKAEAASNKKKRLKILHTVAPGIDLFMGERPGENGFKYFGMADLDLERDFNYSRRSKLVSHGFSEDRISEMLTDRLEFVRHLMPEAQTVLICDQNDFQAIMDFLFYSISVCIDRNLSLLMTKAFFDLRRNYGFPWSLTLKHVLTVLLNFGACEEAVYNQVEYRKNLEKHLEAVKRSGQKVKPFELPSLPHFVENKRRKLQEVLEKVVETEEEVLDEENVVKENETKPERITAEQFKLCLDSFILLLTDFSAGQPSYAEFREKNNWSDKLILIYLLLVMD